MYDPKEVFKALPHVEKIWVTEDGNFHLHPHNGGKEINRNEIETSVINVVDNGGEEISQPSQLQKETLHPPTKRVYNKRHK